MLQDIDLPDQATHYPDLPDRLSAAHDDCATLGADDAPARLAIAVQAIQGGLS